MSKGIIVFDIPEKCNQCRFWFSKATLPAEYRCTAKQKELETITDKPSWCPILEMPKKRDYKGPDAVVGFSAHDRADVAIHEAGKLGWNSCIDEILRETGD